PRIDHPHLHPVNHPLRPADRFATRGASPLAKEVERGLELAAGVDGFDVHGCRLSFRSASLASTSCALKIRSASSIANACSRSFSAFASASLFAIRSSATECKHS